MGLRLTIELQYSEGESLYSHCTVTVLYTILYSKGGVVSRGQV